MQAQILKYVFQKNAKLGQIFIHITFAIPNEIACVIQLQRITFLWLVTREVMERILIGQRIKVSNKINFNRFLFGLGSMLLSVCSLFPVPIVALICEIRLTTT